MQSMTLVDARGVGVGISRRSIGDLWRRTGVSAESRVGTTSKVPDDAVERGLEVQPSGDVHVFWFEL